MSEMLDRTQLRQVAQGQRNVILAVLAQVLIYAAAIVFAQVQMVQFALAVIALGVLVFAIVSVLALARALGRPAVLYVILMFIPCVSTLTLLVLNGAATSHLKAAGIRVGLLGADPNSV